MSCRVLIVEDEALQADNLEVMLRQGGHTVCGKATSAAGALYLARTRKPDIVFMDVKIAGSKDGVEAAETILKAHACGMIYISAYAASATRARIQSATPAAVVLSKPALWREIEAACAHVSLASTSPEPQLQVWDVIKEACEFNEER